MSRSRAARATGLIAGILVLISASACNNIFEWTVDGGRPASPKRSD